LPIRQQHSTGNMPTLRPLSCISWMSRAMYVFVRLFTPQFLWKETGSNTVRIPLPRTPFASLVVIQMERIFYLWMLRPICFYSEPMAMEETFFRVSCLADVCRY